MHVHSCGNGANQCHLHVHFHGCTQVKLYIYHFMTLIIMIIGKRKYWRWIHPAIWALTLGRSQQYCHGIPSGNKLLNLVKLSSTHPSLQIKTNWFQGNPGGCWNFWGYLGDEANYQYATKEGYQLAAVARLVERVANISMF